MTIYLWFFHVTKSFFVSLVVFEARFKMGFFSSTTKNASCSLCMSELPYHKINESRALSARFFENDEPKIGLK